MAEGVRVVLYGVGAIGGRIARSLLDRGDAEIVGAIDIAEDKVGKDLGGAVGVEGRLGVTVSDDPDGVLSEAKPDVVIHATTSYLREAYPQIAKAVRHGANVVSTCEELSYPYVSEPEIAMRLNQLAKEHGVTVLGTGINPGFLMDTLVITLTGACLRVDRIRVTRVIDAARRRVPFQRKVGVGLTVDEFNERMARKVITGHVGLRQSIGMIADALGWELDGIEEGAVEPVVAQTRMEEGGIRLEAGQVAGLRQQARAIKGGEVVISLEFRAYVGAEEYDSIVIEGLPSIRERIEPCVHGDLGTVALVINSIPKVIESPPGLKTMKDLPIPSARRHLG